MGKKGDDCGGSVSTLHRRYLVDLVAGKRY